MKHTYQQPETVILPISLHYPLCAGSAGGGTGGGDNLGGGGTGNDPWTEGRAPIQ